ncbi:MAG: WYL domain-containing protein [Clostridia bacterium]|nr:WYL domain-containing protein [Clostridia bacterium]
MAKGSNQKLKLLYLWRIFNELTDESHGLTLAEISEELGKYEISSERKSLYDDIEMLKLFGMDIKVVRDRKVRYYLDSHTFEIAELKLLVDAVESSKFITEKKSNSLIKKLEGFASKYDAAKLRRQVLVSGRLKAENEEIFCNVDMIHRAIAENRKICFRYFDWTASKRRELRRNGDFYKISPWALSWDDENYYLIGYDSEAECIKHFRVDKMIELYMDKEKRDGAQSFSDFDMTVYRKQVFGMYGGEACNVIINCDASLSGVVIDRFGRDVTISDHGETFTFSAKVMLSPNFYSWVLSFGGRMKIESPPYVAEEVAKLAHEALERYNEN